MDAAGEILIRMSNFNKRNIEIALTFQLGFGAQSMRGWKDIQQRAGLTKPVEMLDEVRMSIFR